MCLTYLKLEGVCFWASVKWGTGYAPVGWARHSRLQALHATGCLCLLPGTIPLQGQADKLTVKLRALYHHEASLNCLGLQTTLYRFGCTAPSG